ncbi:hypothetical protein [Cardiobacterium hominis]|jgi:hypothetical protein|uniref:hypothetical protein n=1 Tax=Cardiobacterium hominis TaxID=2718 RepID=UPI00065FD801|nr:hypothetical protein [Cardiobacterium hominis]
MKKTLAPVRNQLKSLLRQLDMDTTQSRDYQNLLYACLPASWRSRVLLGKQEGLQWQLWVANGSDGYQLRFLLSEVEAMLAQKLPHPPKLSVVARPDVWTQQRALPDGGRLYPRRYYSEAEAEAVITAFIEGQLRG